MRNDSFYYLEDLQSLFGVKQRPKVEQLLKLNNIRYLRDGRNAPMVPKKLLDNWGIEDSEDDKIQFA